MSTISHMQQELQLLEEHSNLRRLPRMVHDGRDVIVNGKRMLNLSSNDYLGLASDRALREEFLRALTPDTFLPTSSSSRLLTGNFTVYEELEAELARFFGTEAALVFNSGYHANTGILPTVSDAQTLILADKLVHASLIDGIRLSAAKCIRYRHNDLAQLERLLKEHHSAFRQIIIVTESIFSMDGDQADLPALAELKRRYGNVLLYVDEAHAFGVRGRQGLGCAEESGCTEDIDFLVGTFGKAAYDFADFLHAAGQGYWQLLPLGPTSYGDSPYQSFSTFAGNPYFIDLDLLIKDKLLTRKEVTSCAWGSEPRYVDYGKIYESRFALLEKAKARGWERDREAVAAFESENSRWLPDYALFMALKRHFGMKSWTEWPDEGARLHKTDALERYRAELRGDVELFTYIQFLFFRQWSALKSYINGLGIRIIGDIPIYVAMDSSDVWSEPEKFQLDERNVPVEVSGVPPDYFSADGQLWGNPLYDYEAMQKDGFEWWIRRIGGAAKLYDVIRIDHFRGFESYWAVPYGETTAKNGRWVKGPGMALVGVLTGWFHDIEFIAEDLGYPTPEVTQLLADSRLPGMKVLEFAFDSRDTSSYLPHSYGENCICYTGTHDNAPLALWRTEADKADIAFAVQYLGLNDREGFNRGIIRGGMSSVAKLFVAQMQDWLDLGAGHRMNIPGTSRGNWEWRMLPGEASKKLAGQIREMTRIYGRS